MSDLLKALRTFDALRDGEAGKDQIKRRVLDPIPPSYDKKQVIDDLESSWSPRSSPSTTRVT